MNRKLDTISMLEVQKTCYIYTIYTSFLLFAAVIGGQSVKINIDGRQTDICESGDYTKWSKTTAACSSLNVYLIIK